MRAAILDRLVGGVAIRFVAMILAQFHYGTARVLFSSGPVVAAMVFVPGYMAITRRLRDWYPKRYVTAASLVLCDDLKGHHCHCRKSYTPRDMGRIG